MMVVLGGQGQGQGRQARFQLMPTSRINLKTLCGGVGVSTTTIGEIIGKITPGQNRSPSPCTGSV